MEIQTYGDLKAFLNTLNEEQLKRSAIIVVEDETYNVTDAGFNEEAMIWNEDMIDGYIPVSEYMPDDFDERALDDPFNIIMPIGDIVIISAE